MSTLPAVLRAREAGGKGGGGGGEGGGREGCEGGDGIGRGVEDSASVDDSGSGVEKSPRESCPRESCPSVERCPSAPSAAAHHPILGGVEGKELGRVGSGRSGSEAVKLEREVRGRACVV